MSMRILMTTLALASGAAALHAQTPDSGAFVVRLGRDTIAVERYVRTPQQLIAEAILRTPQTRRYKLTVTFKEDGGVSWYEVQNNAVPGVPNSAPVMRSVVTYVADSARFETWVAAALRPSRAVAAKADMIPLQMPFYSTYETALMRARKSATDTLTMNMLAGTGPLPYVVTWLPADSVTLWHPQGGTMRAHVDKTGRLLGLNAEATTFKVNVTRAKWADLDAYAKRYAAADAQGKALGALSPGDSIEGDLGHGVVMVTYGRPSKRGRVIFGGLVPWGQIWRTGANAASMIHFTIDVEIEGVRVPKGTYSFWTIPERNQWQFIINKQTWQWGTVYDEKQDVARITVQTETVPVPVETFTIDFKPQPPNGALMMLTWDRTRVLVPMKALPPEE
ncbi:MAG: DUF2911 domain-containing protein [Gemmatimonadota bacterium]